MKYIDGKKYMVTGGGVAFEAAIYRDDPYCSFWEFIDIPGCMDCTNEHKAVDFDDIFTSEPLNPLGTFGEPEPSTSGGSCNYYMVDVNNPTTLKDPYTIECNDLIESLGLSFKEANIIKEIFRTANERTNGNGKPGNTEKRAAEKVLFFAIRHAISNGVDIEKFTSEINLK